MQQAMTSYMSLPASCLTIGKACCHSTFKNGLHQRFSCEPKDKNKMRELTFQKPGLVLRFTYVQSYPKKVQLHLAK